MKSIKIPEKVHDELRIYAATVKQNISEVASFAILAELKNSGHKFVYPKIKSSKK